MQHTVTLHEAADTYKITYNYGEAIPIITINGVPTYKAPSLPMARIVVRDMKAGRPPTYDVERWRIPESLGEATDPHLQNLNRLVVALKRHPLAGSIKVFGSAITDKVRPGDIDCLLEADLDYIDPQVRVLLSWATKLYGTFDPFYYWTSQRVLFARNDTANQWIRAKNARTILKAGQAGIPILDFNKTW